ncbi:unnamed protein product [Protopolystoma xenopodis]|uniref:Uncharacterized protein n=1 Tax=Protopolystoma xenopodis TaxID=117903 RepID=A0A448X9A3_9PLAT|nr:unnamed protein product [Protopolystoma xenopodis]
MWPASQFHGGWMWASNDFQSSNLWRRWFAGRKRSRCPSRRHRKCSAHLQSFQSGHTIPYSLGADDGPPRACRLSRGGSLRSHEPGGLRLALRLQPSHGGSDQVRLPDQPTKYSLCLWIDNDSHVEKSRIS